MRAAVILWLLLAVCAALISGCASIGAVELARDALARCGRVEHIALHGGRIHESASAVINCRSTP